jgi:hypothetical protein
LSFIKVLPKFTPFCDQKRIFPDKSLGRAARLGDTDDAREIKMFEGVEKLYSNSCKMVTVSAENAKQ